MIRISKEEAKVGDYVYVDGDSSFCTGSKNKITRIVTRYDSNTSAPYDVICCGHNEYRKDTGECICGASAYRIFGYYREDDDLKYKKKQLRKLKLQVAVKKQKVAKAVVDAISNIKMDGVTIKMEPCYGYLCIYIGADKDDETQKLQDEIDRELY